MSLLVLLACLMAGAQSACLHVDAFVINDEIRWRLFGTRVEQATSDLMSTVSSMFQASSDESSPYGCIRVRLAGQTTWTMTNPMAYPTCAQTGQCGPDTIGTAVDPSVMLDALNAWVKKDAMTKLTSRPVIVLLTGESFPGMSRGISNQGTMCTEDAQVAVSVTTGDPLHDAQLVAHEIGHIVNMPHNADKNSIMVEQSRSSAIPVRFLESDLRHAQGASCAPDVGNAPSRRCGNGIVDEGEQCDPGLAEDACCTDACQLAPGCQCAYSDACCVDGRFAPAGHVCRPARHGVCDQPEVCTGASGACPVDQFAPVGTECDDDLGESSSCYDGRCALSLNSQCRKRPGDQHSFACASHRCDRISRALTNVRGLHEIH
ncbi:hypothetical protein PBRA_002915 [Plasmodiophora brassicae]|uniref:Disintegrin domain-containing protein n=1 Tax=Plasmodiophora brassicae TaxID=37360 RepID=A0A0G4J6H4_PLABS|nr:hypothetical protein PBRA_002915 [Plasmodiophora brassicae]